MSQTQHTVYRLQDDRSGASPYDLKPTSEPIPSIDAHEVLIQIKAVSLNFRDISIADGRYPMSVKENLIPCSDGAGVVVKVGGKVSGFKEGDRVVGCFNPSHMYGPSRDGSNGLGGQVDGVLREYIVLESTGVLTVPEENQFTFPELASLVCAGVTAWNAMYGNLPIKPGQTVLFQGTGGVSLIGLMLAKALGARTIITSSSDSKLATMKDKFGVDFTVNYRQTPDWSSEALRLTGGEGVDFVLENGGSGTIKQSIDCTKHGGQVAIIGFLSKAKQEEMPDVAALILSREVIVRGIKIGSKQLFEDLLQFVTVKNLRPIVDKVFGFGEEDVRKAYEYVAGGSHMGKVCISLE